MKRSIHQIMAAGVLLALGYTFLTAGCATPNPGECSDDEDLLTFGNYFVNAVCKDGRAACADGRPLCWFFINDENGAELRAGCVEEGCLECPEGMLICLMPRLEGSTEKFYRTCVLAEDECWSGSTHKPSVL